MRVWKWREGELACSPFEHAKEAMAAAFTPEGRWVLSASDDGTVRAWEWRTGKPVTPPLRINANPMSLAVTPDGRHVVVGGFLHELAVIDLGDLVPTVADPDALCRWAELLAGQRLHGGGGTVNLSAAEWLDRWRSFRRHSPPPDIARSDVDATVTPGASIQASHTRDDSYISIAFNDLQASLDKTDVLLRGGRVDEAVATSRESIPRLDLAVDRLPYNAPLRRWLALAMVLAGDREGYRRACAETLAYFAGSRDRLIGEAAVGCLLAPDAMDDPSVALQMAETALASDPRVPWAQYVAGLAEFRAGRDERAVAYLGESLKLGTNWIGAPLNYPVLAMAHHRLAHVDEARGWLRKAHHPRADMPDGVKTHQAISAGALPWDRLEFQLLLREADGLILDVSFPADPFIP